MPIKPKKSEKTVTEDAEQFRAGHDANEGEGEASTSLPYVQDVMDAIKSLKTTFGLKFETIAQTLTQVKVSSTDISDKLTETEQALGAHETQIASLETRNMELVAECKRLWEKTRHLEARSRLNNTHIVGIPEKTERLPNRSQHSRERITLQRKRAHRTLQKPNNDRPRAFVVRIHHYQI